MGLREENLNVMLAELLAEKGLKALGEVILRKGGKRPEPDVLIVLNGVRIVIEGKKLGMWDELVQKCQERLDNNVCDICVMVEYSDIKPVYSAYTQLDIKQALLRSKFNIGFLSYLDRVGLDRRISVPSKPEPYRDMGFDDLLSYLMSAYGRVVREDILEPVIRRMDEVLREFASNLTSTINLGRLREVMELREKEREEGE